MSDDDLELGRANEARQAEEQRLEEDRREREMAEQEAERQVARRIRFEQDNPHIVLLENLNKEQGRDIALRFMDIFIRQETEVRKARQRAFEEKSSLFRELTEQNLPENKIDSDDPLYLARKAYKGPMRGLSELIRSDPERWNHDAEECMKKRMMDFSDIVYLSDRAIQRVLRKVDTNQLAASLKSVEGKVQDKVFRNMSKRAAALLMEDMDYMGPTRRSDVRKCQDEIIEVVFRLEEDGDIVIPLGDDDLLV